ncbi:enoyl-CoA hydratase/isomerase family protein [Streptomyces chryseus]
MAGRSVDGELNMTAQSDTPVAVEHNGSVAHLRLNRPGEGNTLNSNLLEALIEALAGERRRSETRVVVLSGSGDTFCAGADMAEFKSEAATDPSGKAVRRLLGLGREACRALSRPDVITIAQIHGKVTGAGVTLALHCDLRVSSDTATYRLPELLLGFPPVGSGTSARLLNEIGASRLRQMILLGDRIDAAVAHTYGIAHHLVPAAELGTAVRRWSRRLSRSDETATRTALRFLAASESASRLGDITAFEDDAFQASLFS